MVIDCEVQHYVVTIEGDGLCLVVQKFFWWDAIWRSIISQLSLLGIIETDQVQKDIPTFFLPLPLPNEFL